MDILEAKSIKSLYPTDIVQFRYSVMGGATGGLIVSVFFVFLDLGSGTTINSIVGTIFLSLLFGSLIGFIPALFTGNWVAKDEIVIQSKKDYVELFKIGFIVSSIYSLFIIVITIVCMLYLSIDISFDGFLSNIIKVLSTGLLLAIVVGIIGGLSSLILGKLIVPKAIVKNHLSK